MSSYLQVLQFASLKENLSCEYFHNAEDVQPPPIIVDILLRLSSHLGIHSDGVPSM